jgi:transaldolase
MQLDVLRDQGQSVWLDDLDRRLLESGELARLIDAGVTGLTSNPSTFATALSGDEWYRGDLAARGRAAPGRTAQALYADLAIADVQAAADLLRPVYEHEGGRDGFTSLEVSPHLAQDARATVDEARRLWRALERPNVLIKVPGTRACLPAITQLIAEGINVNVTLLFSPERYAEVVDAWLTGLERCRVAGHPLDGIASVASFFVSRLDVAVEARLAALAESRTGPGATHDALRGHAAVALAAAALAHFEALRRSPRWTSLGEQGAQLQRLLWASTGSKNPAQRDVVYVERLVAPDTITTLPRATLQAFLDHGEAPKPLDPSAGEHAAVLAGLEALGVDLRAVARELEIEGVARFVRAYEDGLACVTAALDAAAAAAAAGEVRR